MLDTEAWHEAKGTEQGNRSGIWSCSVMGRFVPHCAPNSTLLACMLAFTFPAFSITKNCRCFMAWLDAFVHASTTEQWGLVVNEAMASGLPVMVSNRCGCVFDLVREGCNGFAFDPYDVEQLARLMLRVGEMEDEERTQMGDVSRRIIAGWGPDRFARGLGEAIECAMRVGPIRAGLLDRLLLRGLILR